MLPSINFTASGSFDTMLETKFGTAPQKIALVAFSAHVDQIWAFPPNVDALHYVLTHRDIS